MGALLLSLLFRPVLEPIIYFFFLLATWLSARYFGRMGGLVAMAASIAAMVYFFLTPFHWSEGVRLVAFISMAAAMIGVTTAWRDSRLLFRSTLSSIADAVIVTDRDGHVRFLNPVGEALTGWPWREARGRRSAEVLRIVDEKTREPMEDPVALALRDNTAVTGKPATLISRNGAEAPIEHSASPRRDTSGQVRGAVLVFRDVSKRRQFEQQATHSQKMEAVERLAAGVAGDFNNVLTVITGYAELMRAEAAANSALRRYADEIIYAGERAAVLTRHLQAFSRGSSTQAGVLDLNRVISGMEPMLRRMLGQGVDLLLLTAPGLGRVKADPEQIEQVIANLAANSRDAMPNGGRLVIETANVEIAEEQQGQNLGVSPGSYVMLAVSDTGVGMDVETRQRLFEPFFTTKQPGKGSGMGLSLVYGAVKQSDGHVSVYSQPACGTIFEIYLPRVKEAVSEPVRRASARGSETILLVDDEEGVRRLVSAVLKTNGYEVLDAPNGVSAMAAYEKNGHKIDMVLTDIVMPQMNGLELGQRLAEQAPELKVLYMSGYRDHAIVGAGETLKPFLLKPFTPDVLLAKVREVLDTH